MANKIQVKRGLKSNMPSSGLAGEPMFGLDTNELFMGTGNSKINVSGSTWYEGTALSGTVTTAGYYSYSACPLVKVGDIYLNTSNGNMYKCSTAGSGSTAKWTYMNKKLLTLSDSVSSTSGASSGVAATPYAVKQAYDRITANNLNTCDFDHPSKMVYTNSEASFNSYEFTANGTFVFEGMGAGKTTFYWNGESGGGSAQIFVFINATVVMTSNERADDGANYVFINCSVRDNSTEMFCGRGNLRFINCDLEMNYGYSGSISDCGNGIITTGKVEIMGGSVKINSGSTTEGYDANFIYQAGKLTMQGVTVTTSGTSTGRINIVRNCNDATITGCHFYLNGTMHSIGHIADTDKTVGGSFTGNYVEYYKTYMRFAAISGNTFNHLAAGSSSANQIILQCPTCMTGNHFYGPVAYVDAQSQKVIVDRNLHDNGLTVGSTASGSITTNNLQY